MDPRHKKDRLTHFFPKLFLVVFESRCLTNKRYFMTTNGSSKQTLAKLATASVKANKEPAVPPLNVRNGKTWQQH